MWKLSSALELSQENRIIQLKMKRPGEFVSVRGAVIYLKYFCMLHILDLAQ